MRLCITCTSVFVGNKRWIINSLQEFHLIFPGKVAENFPEHINDVVLLSKEFTSSGKLQKKKKEAKVRKIKRLNIKNMKT